MRKQFAEFLHDEMSLNEDIHVLTGDLGYGLWDKIKLDYPDRFINFLSSEQLMLGAACGMALEGKVPVVYSITPFLLYRPFEWIRNYLNNEKIPVKLVGGGRDKDYGYLGFSHWAEEDVKILSEFDNIKLYKPSTPEIKIFKRMLYNNEPSYLNLKR
jgi:transketolase|tara:strand:- start:197 stop:667 length:471 start_codon:yes stop_codon:yes gene_type:complete